MHIAQVLLTISTVFVAASAFEAQVETQAIFDRWRNRIAQEHPECSEMWPITDQEKDTFFRQHELTDTPTFKCYLNCIHVKFNLIDEDGNINRDELYNMFERMTYQMMDICDAGVVEKTDKCERIFEFVNCVLHYEKVYAS